MFNLCVQFICTRVYVYIYKLYMLYRACSSFNATNVSKHSNGPVGRKNLISLIGRTRDVSREAFAASSEPCGRICTFPLKRFIYFMRYYLFLRRGTYIIVTSSAVSLRQACVTSVKKKKGFVISSMGSTYMRCAREKGIIGQFI